MLDVFRWLLLNKSESYQINRCNLVTLLEVHFRYEKSDFIRNAWNCEGWKEYQLFFGEDADLIMPCIYLFEFFWNMSSTRSLGRELETSSPLSCTQMWRIFLDR